MKLRIVISNIINGHSIVVKAALGHVDVDGDDDDSGDEGNCRGRSKARGIDIDACCLQLDRICSEKFNFAYQEPWLVT